MMQIESQVVESFESMKLADYVVRKHYTVDGSVQLLFWRDRGKWFEWRDGKRWTPMSHAEIEDQLWFWLEDLEMRIDNGKGYTSVRLSPDKTKIGNVMRAMEAVCAFAGEVPCWLKGSGPDPRRCVAFDDCVLDVGATAKIYRETGKLEWVKLPRGPEYFSVQSVQMDWDPDAKCPNWENACEQWSGGDPKWTETHERLLGYAFSNERRLERFAMQYGPPRGGKKIATQVPLVGALGKKAVIGRTIPELMGDFGMDGIESCGVLVVPEAQQLTPAQANKFGSVAKAIFGQDEMSVRQFHKGVKSGVVIPALMIIQSNEPFAVANNKRGFTSKMVPQPFDQSFLGKEDIYLADRLKGELPGIVRRCMEALVRLFAEDDPGKWFEVSDRAKRVTREFESEGNLFNRFLNEYFVPDENGWVSFEVLRKVRGWWESESGFVLKNKGGERVSDKHLGSAVVKNSDWTLVKARRVGVKDADSADTRAYGLQGMRLERKH